MIKRLAISKIYGHFNTASSLGFEQIANIEVISIGDMLNCQFEIFRVNTLKIRGSTLGF